MALQPEHVVWLHDFPPKTFSNMFLNGVAFNDVSSLSKKMLINSWASCWTDVLTGCPSKSLNEKQN